MAIQQNPFAEVPAHSTITEAAAAFIESVTFEQIPDDALNIGTRCLMDGLLDIQITPQATWSTIQ